MENEIGCITMPLVPGRKDPSDKSEMVTQLLFGESYRVLETEKNWILINNEADGYECWIDRKQHTPIEEALKFSERVGAVMGEVLENGSGKYLPMGALVERESFRIGKKAYDYKGEIANSSSSPAKLAMKFLGAPYLWGGKSIFGIDCSGFVQVVFACCGIRMPRDAYQQAEVGESVDFVDTTVPGDIAYFDNEEGRITHVGIILDGDKIIHASGSVRIDTLDHQGIFNRDEHSYTHQLRIIKRLSPNLT